MILNRLPNHWLLLLLLLLLVLCNGAWTADMWSAGNQLATCRMAETIGDELDLDRRCDKVTMAPGISQNLLHSLVISRHGDMLTSLASMVLLWCNGPSLASQGNRPSAMDSFLSNLLRMNSQLSQIGLTFDDGSWRAAVVDYSTNSKDRSNALSHSLSKLLAKQSSALEASSRTLEGFQITYLWYNSCTNGLNASQWQIVVLFNASDTYTPSRKCLDKMEAYAFYVALPLHSFNSPICDNLLATVSSAHECDTKCFLVPFEKYRLGAYKCCCFATNTSEQVCTNRTGDGKSLHMTIEALEQVCCKSGDIVEASIAVYESVMAKVFLTVNLAAIVVACVLIFFSASQRKSQENSQAKEVLVEFALIGAILLYTQVILEVFPAQPVICCLLTWCRQLGFTMFYGAIIFIIYKNAAEPSSRRSNQQVSLGRRLLTCCALMIAFALTGLIAWTMSIYDRSPTVGRAPFEVCAVFKWFFFWHAVEICLLLFALYLCFKSRSSFSTKKSRFVTVIFIELIVTSAANGVRYKCWPKLSPTTAMITSFLQVHLTISCALAILLSKYYCKRLEISKNESCRLSSTKRNQSSLAKLRDRILSGTLDFAELPISDMNPEDIRAELKRVYTQLRMFKLTNIYADNPHIVKKKIRKQSHSKRMSGSHGGSKLLYEVGSSKVDNEDLSGALTSNEVESPCKTATGDFTVQSAAHNVYLTGKSLSVAQNTLVENDSSSQI